jgi:alcohol dehydrogenase class IV
MSIGTFTFVTPPRVVVGWGSATDERLVVEAKHLGQRPLIVTGKSLRASGILASLTANLEAAGLVPTLHEGVPPEPDLEAVQAAIETARHSGADSVLAIGGGSVLDVAKGAALAPFAVSAAEWFAGKQAVPETGGLPLLCAPTTAGTGSEATWVGVFVDKATRRKASIRGGAMLPAVAVLDAELTVSCPASVTANSGMDAFVQAVEAYTSSGANPLTDALAFDAALLTGRNLRTAVNEPTDRAAREAMLLGSYMAGVALNTSRLGLVHGLAHPLGAVTGAAHGLLCGLLMPPVMRFNRDAAGAKYQRLANALEIGDSADALITFTESLLTDCGIPKRLSALGFRESDADFIAREAMTSGSTKANPRPVRESDAKAVTLSCL